MGMNTYYEAARILGIPAPQRTLKQRFYLLLKEVITVVATFVVSAVVIFGGIYFVAERLPKVKGSIPELQTRGCRFVSKEWTGKDSSTSNRWATYVYFEFKKTWKCNDGMHYEYVKESMSQGDIIKMLRSGKY